MLGQSEDNRPATGRETVIDVTPALLRDWPLPQPNGGGGKESRGRVLVVGGSIEVPGAVLLAGMGALRAGAGKLHIAVPREVAPGLAIAVPEARVSALPQTEAGDIDPAAAEWLAGASETILAMLIGPGMLDIPTVQELLRRLLPRLKETALVLDAGGLSAVSDDRTALYHLRGAAVLTPHPLEVALMLGIDQDEVIDNPLDVARRAAREARAVVALKGAETYIAAADGTTYRYAEGKIGLATSGSGDTLAGVIAGLLARGAEPAQAAVWGVYLHGEAGTAMTRRMGPLGFLARELLAEIPALLARFDD